MRLDLLMMVKVYSAIGKLLRERRENLNDDIVDDMLLIRNFKKIIPFQFVIKNKINYKNVILFFYLALLESFN